MCQILLLNSEGYGTSAICVDMSWYTAVPALASRRRCSRFPIPECLGWYARCIVCSGVHELLSPRLCLAIILSRLPIINTQYYTTQWKLDHACALDACCCAMLKYPITVPGYKTCWTESWSLAVNTMLKGVAGLGHVLGFNFRARVNMRLGPSLSMYVTFPSIKYQQWTPKHHAMDKFPRRVELLHKIPQLGQLI